MISYRTIQIVSWLLPIFRSTTRTVTQSTTTRATIRSILGKILSHSPLSSVYEGSEGSLLS